MNESPGASPGHRAPGETEIALTLDELRIVQELAPAPVLPDRLRVSAFAALAPEEDPGTRRESALRDLARRGLVVRAEVSVDTPGTGPDKVSIELGPALREILLLGSSAPWVVHTESWVPTHGSRVVFAGVGSPDAGRHVVELRLDIGSDDASPEGERGTACFAIRNTQAFAGRVDVLLEGAPAEPDAQFASTATGLVDAQTLVEAVRANDPATVEAAATSLRAGDALEILRPLAGRITAGLRIRALSADGRLLHHADWIQGSDGRWVATGLRASPGPDGLSADDLVTSGRLALTRTNRALMTAEVLTMLTALEGGIRV